MQKRGLEEEQRRLNDESKKLEQYNMQVHRRSMFSLSNIRPIGRLA